jgi:hypothetical protein
MALEIGEYSRARAGHLAGDLEAGGDGQNTEADRE